MGAGSMSCEGIKMCCKGQKNSVNENGQ